jgi:hypothetical protein
MKKYILPIILISASCGGSLSDEQRKNMREQMELHQIKRVTDVEITEAAFAKGRQWMNSINEAKNDSSRLNSIVKSGHGRIRWVVPGSSNLQDMEKQLIDAYIASESGALEDNVQKIRTTEGESDSILYTKPVLSKLPDGSERFEGVWNIWLSKKELILAMGKKK